MPYDSVTFAQKFRFKTPLLLSPSPYFLISQRILAMTYPLPFFALLIGFGFLLGAISGIVGNVLIFGLVS